MKKTSLSRISLGPYVYTSYLCFLYDGTNKRAPTILVMMSIDITVVIATSAGSDMTVECPCVNHMTWMNKNIKVQKIAFLHNRFYEFISIQQQQQQIYLHDYLFA